MMVVVIFRNVKRCQVNIMDMGETFVGIFWIDYQETGRVQIFADKISLKDAETYGNHKVHAQGHYQLWGKIQQKNRKWIGRHYESVPRGRTVWKDGVFYIYANRIAKDKRIQEKIKTTFGLMGRGCRIKFCFTDEHYEIHNF